MTTLTLPVLYSQQDGRWANVLLGFNTSQPYNFYNYACLITCLAMIARYYGKDDSPVTINDKLKALQPAGFVSGGNYVWGSFQRQYGDIKENRTTTPDALTDEQMGEIRTAIDAGYPVMVQLDYNPKTVEYDMHFVLLVGYNINDENDFTIADPIGGRVHSLKDYLGWFRPSARNTIEQYIIFKGKVPTANSQCLLPNTDEWRKTYEGLVHGSGEWDKTVHEYINESADPKATQFIDIQRVISGIKSRSTDLEHQLNAKTLDFEKAIVEVENQKDKVANTVEQCQRTEELRLAEIDKLKKQAKAAEDMTGSYKGIIAILELKVRELQKENGKKDTQISKLKTDLDNAKKGNANNNSLKRLLGALQKYLGKK